MELRFPLIKVVIFITGCCLNPFNICFCFQCLQAMYNEFSTANIQIDKDFSAKLSGYGCVGHIPEEEVSSNSTVSARLQKHSIYTILAYLINVKFN